jgi:catechol 2,3-dioxygenase-like lactoylglutathione lyase family enzyme
MQRVINGIQQVGIGVADAAAAFTWYKKYFHFDAVVFEDVAQASLMHRYTGGEVHERYAALVMNMQGGGGFEIWQYTSREPRSAKKPYQLGNPGIFAIKLKCRDVDKAHQTFSFEGLKVLSQVMQNPLGQKHFFLKDPFENVFQIVEDDYWFGKKRALIGGVCGAVICVSDMDVALPFYKNILDYKETPYKGEQAADLMSITGGASVQQRRFFKNSPSFSGAFSKLLGPTTIELVQMGGEKKAKIFEDRWWGDLGFIHVCYDLCNMRHHENICATAGQPLTVNSGNSFEMGQAAGQFAYNEDPDGTLIEYVETHKVPILKSWGWYLDLRKRKIQKPLPNWMIRCMGLGKKDLQLTTSYLTCTKAQAVNGSNMAAATPGAVPKMQPKMHANRGQ